MSNEPSTDARAYALASSDNPRSRQHQENYSAGYSSWRCVPIRDIVDMRDAWITRPDLETALAASRAETAAAVAIVRALHHTGASIPLGDDDAARAFRAAWGDAWLLLNGPIEAAAQAHDAEVRQRAYNVGYVDGEKGWRRRNYLAQSPAASDE